MEPLIVQQPPEAERHEEGEGKGLEAAGDAARREAAQEREHLARQRSFAERYSEMFPRMLLYARKHVAPDDAYDIVQDVLAGMWKNWDLIPPGARDGPQLYLSAVRKRLSTFRRKESFRAQGVVRYVAEQHESDKDLDAERGEQPDWELPQIVERVVAGFPRRRRAVWYLVRESGLLYKEAAPALGVTVHAVRRAMSLALTTVRAALVQAGYEAELAQRLTSAAADKENADAE